MASRLDYAVLMWSLQLHESAFDAAGNVRYVVDHLQPGTILLAHDTGNATRKVGLAALPSLVTEVRKQGYEFVTVSELLAAGTPAPRPSPARP
jgi:peptidoglycan/xylan/chitin deacetylase (PgdA/CDA1 family)